jgi:hypothetical protein
VFDGMNRCVGAVNIRGHMELFMTLNTLFALWFISILGAVAMFLRADSQTLVVNHSVVSRSSFMGGSGVHVVRGGMHVVVSRVHIVVSGVHVVVSRSSFMVGVGSGMHVVVSRVHIVVSGVHVVDSRIRVMSGFERHVMFSRTSDVGRVVVHIVFSGKMRFKMIL